MKSAKSFGLQQSPTSKSASYVSPQLGLKRKQFQEKLSGLHTGFT